MGDSFTEGTGATDYLKSWPKVVERLLDWDVTASGLGGTGYCNPGLNGRVNFGDRLQADVLDSNADIVIVAGGINDGGFSAATVEAAAADLFARIRAGLPNAQLIVVAPFWRNGADTFPPFLLDTKDAIKEAALATDAIWIDLLEMPLRDGQSVSTMLNTAIAANATSLTIPVLLPMGSTIEIGTGALRERRVVHQVSGSDGAWNYAGLLPLFAHAAGTAVTLVGASLLTGTGHAGNPQGDGNSDVAVTGDPQNPTQNGTHPTDYGHLMHAHAIATQIVTAVNKE